MSRRGTWQEVYQRFDVYMTPASWRADRALSPAREIVELLDSPFGSDARILVIEDLGNGALVTPPLLDRLAYYSAGRARDFVKMIRMVAQKSWQADVDSATADMSTMSSTRSAACSRWGCTAGTSTSSTP